MFLTFRYRLLPTRRQHRALEHVLECQRELYNAALQERIEAYRRAGVTRTYYDQTSALTEWRASDPEARACPVLIQRATLRRVDHAYRGFLQRKATGPVQGRPRFQGPGRFNSFAFAGFSGIRLVGQELRFFSGVPGRLRVHFHRPLPPAASIRSCWFRREGRGWHVGFVVDVAESPIKRQGQAVGVDLGLTHFAVLSDGTVIPSLRAARRAQAKLRRAQRSMCRKATGSNSWKKAKAAVKKCHLDTRQARANHLHQVSRMLVNNYSIIALEELHIAPMARGTFANDVRDAAWGTLVSMIRYKAEWAGARVIGVDCRQTSQVCSSCGSWSPTPLWVRVHECADCGVTMPRDLNAAKTILNRAGVGPGLRNVAPLGMRAGGSTDREPARSLPNPFTSAKP